jgi:hypothetical protein
LRTLLSKRPDRQRQYKNCKEQCEMFRFHNSSTWNFGLGPDGPVNFERPVLSLVRTDIAGAVPTWTSL